MIVSPITPDGFQAELATLINVFGRKLSDNQIIDALTRALEEAQAEADACYREEAEDLRRDNALEPDFRRLGQ